jgi:hypothetical protein
MLSHTGPGSTLEYVIRQTTQVRRGRVVQLVNQTLDGASAPHDRSHRAIWAAARNRRPAAMPAT